MNVFFVPFQQKSLVIFPSILGQMLCVSIDFLKQNIQEQFPKILIQYCGWNNWRDLLSFTVSGYKFNL